MTSIISAKEWEERLIDYFNTHEEESSDGSHDLNHFRRVYQTACQLAAGEKADPCVMVAAAYLHDVVSLPKNHIDSKLSSRLAAIKAQEILRSMAFPEEKIERVSHAIEAHSFSANITPLTIEAKIIQDADRMESLGVLGILRTFYVAGRLKTKPYHKEDLYAQSRPLDDKSYALDHFYCKLFKLTDLLQTEAGRQLAERRTRLMSDFIEQLASDIQKSSEPREILAIIAACYSAGNESMQLFHPKDPLALDREVLPNLYAIDRLIDSLKISHTVRRSQAEEKQERVLNATPFISRFLQQLCLELS